MRKHALLLLCRASTNLMGGEIQYRFASDAAQRIVDIRELKYPPNQQSLNRYECIGCGERLVAHLKDDRRTRHFAHHRVGNCSFESYLHQSAKLAFVTTYRECVQSGRPFLLHVPVDDHCVDLYSSLGFRCSWPSTRTFDLTRWFDAATVEGNWGAFRADILLTRTMSSAPLLVEIAVTHACEPAKLNSGARIIEIRVSSEEHIALIRSADLHVKKDSPVRVHNFKIKAEEKVFCKHKCPKQVATFAVLRNGRGMLLAGPASEAPFFNTDQFNVDDVVWHKVLAQVQEGAVWQSIDQWRYLAGDLPAGDNMLQRASADAITQGVRVVNCEVCVRQGSYASNLRWCHHYHKLVAATEAEDCEGFRSVKDDKELQRIRRNSQAQLSRRRSP